jgi:hypothetical protein
VWIEEYTKQGIVYILYLVALKSRRRCPLNSNNVILPVTTYKSRNVHWLFKMDNVPIYTKPDLNFSTKIGVTLAGLLIFSPRIFPNGKISVGGCFFGERSGRSGPACQQTG